MAASKKTHSARNVMNVRFLVIECAAIAIFAIIAVALFVIQIVNRDRLLAEAYSQWTRSSKISAKRGNIYDKNGKILAQDIQAYKLLIWPKEVDESDVERIATELSSLLGVDKAKITQSLTNTKLSEIVLKRGLSADVKDKILELKLGSGIRVVEDTKRFYPYSDALSQVIGLTNADGDGQIGIELKYNTELAGTDGYIVRDKDGRGESTAYGSEERIEAIDGCDLYLTVDINMTGFLDKALEEALEVNNAKSAQGIIVDAKTGAILAISTKPGYDLNNPPRGEGQIEAFNALSRNKIVTDIYEPGSTFKVITLAAGLDSGRINKNYSITCPGSYTVNGESIKCWKSGGHGTQNLTECAENSCNCAFMDIALKLGTDEMYNYISGFGFGNSTDSGLVGEVSGIVTHKKYVRNADLARIGFGQSISVTPLQLVTAISAAVNGGELMQPYIVDRVVSADGKEILKTEPTVKRRVITSETSAIVREILESVVENGSGKNAQINGYRVGGKTGTAQKYEDGKIAEGKLIASFVGVAPMDDPRYVCLILVDEPQVGTIFGSTVAAPFVKQVLEETLQYMDVPKNGGEETVTVPDLRGKTVAEAVEILAELGLRADFQETDEIINQVPMPGEKAIVGTSVLLYTQNTSIVIQYTTVQVPDLTGMTYSQAKRTLEELGLLIAVDGETTEGVVTYQDKRVNTELIKGETVTVKFG